MKKRIVLSQSDLHNIVKESVKRIINEGAYVPNQQYNYQQTINGSNSMQGAVNNGGQSAQANEYLANQNTYYGYIAKLAQQNNTNYTTVISNLQNKVNYYLNNGYFGQNQEVTSTIKLFSELLSYLHAAYESAASRVMKKQMGEGVRDFVDNLRYKNTNQYGVNQKIRDNSGNQYAVNQMNGQWMRDLQGELQQLLQWNFLHGKKTVEATNLFINFLNVEKRNPMAFIKGKINTNYIQAMKKLLAGVTMLAVALSANNGLPTNQQQMNPNIQQTTMNTQQSRTVNVMFNVNGSNISQQSIAQLRQMAQNARSITIIVHESQNQSGQDASYESQLIQQRANNIMKCIGKNANVQRGQNSLTQPYAEVVFN